MGTNNDYFSSPCCASSSSSSTSSSPYYFSSDHRVDGRPSTSRRRRRHPAGRFTREEYLSTDLRLGLSISPPHHHPLPLPLSSSSSPRPPREKEMVKCWPPIKPRSTRTPIISGKIEMMRRPAALFVKVYMESNPIGRKLDLFAHDDYNDLVSTLQVMFRTSIFCTPSVEADLVHSDKTRCHVLVYEDREGDWMMVGDVPWELFLSNVKRLKITRPERR